jgi:hypothetical protein
MIVIVTVPVNIGLTKKTIVTMILTVIMKMMRVMIVVIKARVTVGSLKKHFE